MYADTKSGSNRIIFSAVKIVTNRHVLHCRSLMHQHQFKLQNAFSCPYSMQKGIISRVGVFMSECFT